MLKNHLNSDPMRLGARLRRSGVSGSWDLPWLWAGLPVYVNIRRSWMHLFALEREASCGASSGKTTLVCYIPDIVESNLSWIQQNHSSALHVDSVSLNAELIFQHSIMLKVNQHQYSKNTGKWVLASSEQLEVLSINLHVILWIINDYIKFGD